MLLGRAQPVIPPNLYSAVNEHNSLGSPGKLYVICNCNRVWRVKKSVLSYEASTLSVQHTVEF